MAKFPAWTLLAIFSFLAVKVLSNDLDITDALEVEPTKPTAPEPTPEPAEVPEGDLKLDLDDEPPTQAPEEIVTAATTKAPEVPQLKTGNQEASDDLDLEDALDPKNDIGGKDKDKNNKGGKGTGNEGKGDGSPSNRGGESDGLSDDDLLDIGNGGKYSPDKGTDGGKTSEDDNNYDTMAETGTIAGIVSAVAMALVGAVSSYISYQKKKLCFSIQQGLNADITKGENPEAVVSQEPQAQQTLLQSPNAENPNNDNNV